MLRNIKKSMYWNSHDALDILRRLSGYEDEKSYRPTVVVPIIDYAGRPLVVRHNNPEQNWGLIQGHIETYDEHPLAAGRREAYEEGAVSDLSVGGLFPYLGEEGMEKIARDFMTGYTLGGYYVFVGIQLKQGADVSTVPPPDQPVALLERKWCTSLDQAIAILREQPGSQKNPATLQKVERVLIPALQSIYQPESAALLELLDPIT